MAISQETGSMNPGLGGEPGRPGEALSSGVAWPAVIAGAFVAAAVSLLLLMLGSGIGLASVSPWSGSGVSATTFTLAAAIWLVIVQWLASGLGGYFAGRLRTKWSGAHTHEVFFRDTAHGLLTWAVAAVISVGVLGSAVSSVVSGGTHMAAGLASSVTQGATQSMGQSSGNGDSGYFVDSLFRSDHPTRTLRPARSELKLAASSRRGCATVRCQRPTRPVLRNLWPREPGCRKPTHKNALTT
jgi:hypothetical protein